jgi:hypothetical protein
MILTGLAGLFMGGAALQAATSEPPPRSNLRYDFDYPDLNYTQGVTNNEISRLQDRIDDGEAELTLHPVRGYLDSLLKELGIDPSSQVLIYSKTSLQVDYIDAPTPRAIYFNDSTYIGSVQGSPLQEIATVDPKLGVMFYSVLSQASKPHFSRESGRCLNCHDTYSMMGGGTPRVVVTSAPVIRPDGAPPAETSSVSTDRTPFSERWGGWYVTGHTGGQPHLGNLPLEDPRVKLGTLKGQPKDLTTLSGLFNTGPYLTDKSDVVALMVLEHQTNVQNYMTRALYKARTALTRVAGPDAHPQTWAELPPVLQKAFLPLVEPLSQALLMEGVIRLDAPISGNAGFEAYFQAQGPRDPQGRSLRELDLQDRVFRYPLSYQVYTAAFDGLPPYLRDYLYSRITRTLLAPDGPAETARLRKAAYDILLATKPEFALRRGVNLSAR